MSDDLYCTKHKRSREVGEHCPDCESDIILTLKEEITRLRAKLEDSQKWGAVFRQYFDDSQDGMECLSGCDSIAHDDDCPVVNPMAAFRKLRAKLVEEEIDHGRVIAERDYWETKATELANDIGEALGFDVGEHSNMNCPVQNAIDGVAEMRSQIDDWHKLAEVEGQECVVMLAVNTENGEVDYDYLQYDMRSEQETKTEAMALVDGWEYRAFKVVPLTHPAPAKVPDEKSIWCVKSDNEVHFNAGWNACREAMLKSQQEV